MGLIRRRQGRLSDSKIESPPSICLGLRGSHSVGQGPSPRDEIARIGIDRPFLLDPANRCLYEFNIESPCETPGDFVLSLGQVGAIGVEPICPKLRAAFAIDQLHVDPNLVTNPPHAAFEDVADAELTANLLRVHGFSLVGKSRVAGDYEAAGNP
jgi:hypothetical protein